jgi:tetratricopeptide (TPR) repeat protein
MRKLGTIGILTVLICLCSLISAGVKPSSAFVYPDRIATSKSLAHYAMGQVYDLLGMTNQAVLEYENAARFDESSYLIRLRLGTDYARLNLLPEAIEELRLVQKFNPDDLQAHYLLALIYSDRREFDKAAEEYESILKKFSKVEPRNAEIYGYLGQLYYSQRKYDQAIAQFEKILDLDPQNADVMYLLGSLYVEVKADDKAENILKLSLEIAPDHDGSLNTLGYLYAEQGKNLDKAEEFVSLALELSPNNGAYLDSMGWIHYKKADYENALKFLEKADAVLQDPVIFDHLGDVHLKLNNVDKALHYWQRSLELQPDAEEIIQKINNINQRQASHQSVK